jgi:hypothetical protein
VLWIERALQFPDPCSHDSLCVRALRAVTSMLHQKGAGPQCVSGCGNEEENAFFCQECDPS